MTELAIFAKPAPYNFIEVLSKFTELLFKKANQDFSLQGLVLTSSMFSKPNGFLPILMNASKNNLEKIWGEQDLILLAKEEQTLVGVEVKNPTTSLPISLWMLSLHQVIEDAIKNEYQDELKYIKDIKELSGKIVKLDDILSQYIIDLTLKKITLVEYKNSPTPYTLNN